MGRILVWGCSVLALVSVGTTLAQAESLPNGEVLSDQLSSASVEETCISAATKRLKIPVGVMKGRGDPSRQGVAMNIFSEAMPPECQANYRRFMEGAIYMKNEARRHAVLLVKERVRHIENDVIQIPGSVGRGPGSHNGWPKPESTVRLPSST